MTELNVGDKVWWQDNPKSVRIEATIKEFVEAKDGDEIVPAARLLSFGQEAIAKVSDLKPMEAA